MFNWSVICSCAYGNTMFMPHIVYAICVIYVEVYLEMCVLSVVYVEVYVVSRSLCCLSACCLCCLYFMLLCC